MSDYRCGYSRLIDRQEAIYSEWGLSIFTSRLIDRQKAIYSGDCLFLGYVGRLSGTLSTVTYTVCEYLWKKYKQTSCG